MFFTGFHYTRRAEEGEGNHNERNQGKGRADCKHHKENTDSSSHLSYKGGQILTDGIVDGIHVIGKNTEQLAAGMAVVIAELHTVHFFADILTKLLHNLGRDFCHQKAL